MKKYKIAVAGTLKAQSAEVLVVEPNIETHKEFKGIKIFGKEVIDFCGVANK